MPSDPFNDALAALPQIKRVNDNTFELDGLRFVISNYQQAELESHSQEWIWYSIGVAYGRAMKSREAGNA